MGNFFRFKSFPKQIMKYGSRYKNKKDIYKHITQEHAPYFIVKNEEIYTLEELGSEYSVFKSNILKAEEKKVILFREILDNKVLRNYFTELINEPLKSFLRSRFLNYDKNYGRFYFRLLRDKGLFSVQATTRKRG